MFRVQIDRSLCSGFGSCVDAAPELFRLGDDGIAVALVENLDAAALLDTVRSCPMGAIFALLDEQGQEAAWLAKGAVVGAGLAGSRCAEVLRAEGFEGEIVLAGDEEHPPYERLALCELLAGRRDDISLRAHGFWREREIDLRLETRVRRIDVGRRLARTSARPIRWDALVLATGAHPRRLPALDGRPGVHALRTRADAEALRAALRPGRRLAIVGAGFVGAGVASTARSSASRSPCSRPATRRSRRSSGRRSGASLPSAMPLRGGGRASARGLRG